MKRLIGLIMMILILYVIYFDLSKGTLPSADTTATVQQEEPAETEELIDYFEIKVQSGDTVLSIIEQQLDASVSVPIQQVIEDFQKLNNGTSAEQIQIGKTYKFPDYRDLAE
ncbi:LysM peptidoglycan-binding domain-containing protein [Robertmurraya andreesenii]|uniref:LysM domain-containing protein n=1 Tax=Anoxybacillus andreesenii TaxID=1325932 RepID=A0ABT9V5Y8_9BACL|nr:LysM domain-containing protein [Robertmurraya andreesenii]MDQ0156368.1 hypothetical protein [Robertmurraya andreesenii]